MEILHYLKLKAFFIKDSLNNATLRMFAGKAELIGTEWIKIKDLGWLNKAVKKTY